MFLLRFWLFRTVAKLRLLFVCVCVFFFQVPLTSCASPWRAGETRNNAPPQQLTLLRHRTFYSALGEYRYNSGIRYRVFHDFRA